MPPKKYCRRTKKVSGSMLFDMFRSYLDYKSSQNARKTFYGGIKNLIANRSELDTNRTRRKIKKMKDILKINNINKNNSIFKDMSEIERALNAIDYLHKIREYYEEKIQIQKVIKLYKKVRAKYVKLTK